MSAADGSAEAAPRTGAAAQEAFRAARRALRRERAAIDTLSICDWLPPEFGAVGQYSLLFARQMAAEGQRVVLIGLTAAAPSIEHERFETSGGALTIHRIAAPRYDKGSLSRRLWWTAKTNTRLLRAAWPLLPRAGRVLFTGSPPLFLHWMGPSKLWHGKRLVYRITDFHPECAIAERGGAPSLPQRALLALTWFWRRRVDEFEALGLDQAERLRAGGVPAAQITFKPDPAPVAVCAKVPPLARPAGSDGAALLLYSGNWGVAHDVDTFIEGYRRHHAAGGGVTLWLNAVGSGAEQVADALSAFSLPLIRSAPAPLDQLSALLVTPDAHLVTLKDEFVGYVMPSKIHGCAASGKPTLFIGSDASDANRIGRSGLGPRFARAPVGAPEAVAEWLDDLALSAAAARRSEAPSPHERLAG
ncbi:MAG: hypothetical protein AAGM38_05855 [Pseudomonadota bacterium]